MTLISVFTSTSASAYTFGAEYIDTWGGSCGCNANNLSYTGDQVKAFASAATSMGNTQRFLYANNQAEATDIMEDDVQVASSGGKRFFGMDNVYGDTVDMFVFAGHGGVYSDGSVFTMPMCSLEHDARDRQQLCNFTTQNARWGELSGTSPGRMRWAVLATCYGVDEHPNRVWGNVANTGLEYIVGYRGLSYDSYSTRDALAKWARSIANGDSFKDAWFTAIRNACNEDVGAVVSFGTTRFEAIGRRDNQTLTSERRTSDQPTRWIAWAWKKARGS